MSSEFFVKVLHVSPEFAPLAKKGGLGDVAGALPRALRGHNIDARVLMPAWPGVLDAARKDFSLSSRPVGKVHVALNWRVVSANVWKATVNSVPVYILENDEMFSDENIYPTEAEAANAECFIFLSYAAFELSNAVNWKPVIIHSHDWPTAIIPSALRWHRYYKSLSHDFDTVFTIHNMAHQGLFKPEDLNGWGIMPESFRAMAAGSLEFYGLVNLVKGAIDNSEGVTTVSPRYADDIQTRDGGKGLEGVVASNVHKLRGILNGIDCAVWNPKTDNLIPANYDMCDLTGKKKCREKMLRDFGWEDDGRPVLAFVGRLTEQKGVDIMLPALESFVSQRARAVIVGSGSEYFNRALREFEEAHKDSVHTVMRFSEEAAHRVYAASDILLMPSLFEPCGLSQLIAFAYGTVPVARATGGLADTVRDADANPDGDGFLFYDYSVPALCDAIHRALEAKNNAERWNEIMLRGMKKDLSWDTSAEKYAELYRNIIDL